MSQLRDLLNSASPTDLELEEVKKVSHRGSYDLVESGKSRLLVTIGDSWTYGWRLNEEFANDPEQGRITHCYGYLLAKHYGADSLNWSIPAINNLWMVDKYRTLIDLADNLDYDEILVFITLTEYGREIYTEFDSDPELNTMYSQCNRPTDLARALSTYLSARLLQHSHPKIQLRLGLNYVNNLYSQDLATKFISPSWIECLTGEQFTDECLVVGSWVVEKYNLLSKQINQSADPIVCKEEVLGMVDSAQKRLNMIFSSPYNYKVGYGHPNTKGHQIWANYLIQNKVFGNQKTHYG
jgi:hypothetical protein